MTSKAHQSWLETWGRHKVWWPKKKSRRMENWRSFCHLNILSLDVCAVTSRFWGETFVKKHYFFVKTNFFHFLTRKVELRSFFFDEWDVWKCTYYIFFSNCYNNQRVEKYPFFEKSWLGTSFHWSIILSENIPKCSFCRHNNFTSHITYIVTTYELQHREINYRGSRYRPTCHMD